MLWPEEGLIGHQREAGRKDDLFLRKRKHRVTWRYPMFSGGEKNRYLNFYCLIGSGAFALKFKPPYFIVL